MGVAHPGIGDGHRPSDRALIAKVLGQLVAGMQTDLRRFPAAGSVHRAEQVVALQSLDELDEYTYFAAGCVGEFWTELCAAHLPGLEHLTEPSLQKRGVALGKALQLTNVVRDLAADLRIGRCYIPTSLLTKYGLSAGRLFALTAEPPQSLAEARALRSGHPPWFAEAAPGPPPGWLPDSSPPSETALGPAPPRPVPWSPCH